MTATGVQGRAVYKHFLQTALCLKLPKGIAKNRSKLHEPPFKGKQMFFCS